MRDHVTDELISAYVDGELEGDELKFVERLLAKSAEHRQLLAEFQSLRASIGALPKSNLPADFHTQVVAQIDELAVSPSKEPVSRVGNQPNTRPWRKVLLAAASLAAVVALTVMLRPPTAKVEIPGSTGIEMPRPVPVYLQAVPQYVLVYDVTVTPRGQRNRVVEKLLADFGIGLDPGLRLDKSLESELKAIRESQRIPGATESVPYKNDPATPKSTVNDKVEMIYVAAKLNSLDQLGTGLQKMDSVGQDVTQLRYDLVSEPNKLGVMHRLHDSAREHFAHSDNVRSSDNGYAISFRMELKMMSIPGAAAFPIPMFQTRDSEPVGHILLIIRNVDANAGEEN